MSDRSVGGEGLFGKGERLIGIADTHVADDFVIEEFVADDRGGYYFYDCPVTGEHRGERYRQKTFYSPLEALRAWNERTGAGLSHLDVFRGISA